MPARQLAALMDLTPGVGLRDRANSSRAFIDLLSLITRVFVTREVCLCGAPRALIDDAVQDVLLQLWRSAEQIRAVDADSVLAWLRKASRHVTLNHLRTDSRARAIEQAWPGTHHLPGNHGGISAGAVTNAVVDDARGPPGDVMAKEREEAIAEAIARLPQPQRDMLLRCIIHGESKAAIARRLGTSRRTASREIEDATDTLSRLLAPYVDAPDQGFP